MAKHSTAWHSIAQHRRPQHSTAEQNTAHHGTARHGTAWHSKARHSKAHLSQLCVWSCVKPLRPEALAAALLHNKPQARPWGQAGGVTPAPHKHCRKDAGMQGACPAASPPEYVVVHGNSSYQATAWHTRLCCEPPAVAAVGYQRLPHKHSQRHRNSNEISRVGQ
jgi:hypothetical protein